MMLLTPIRSPLPINNCSSAISPSYRGVMTNGRVRRRGSKRFVRDAPALAPVRQPRRLCGFDKGRVAPVLEVADPIHTEVVRIVLASAAGDRPAVDAKDVEIAVVIEVLHAGAPSPSAVVHPSGWCGVNEGSQAIIDIQPVAVLVVLLARLFDDRGYEPIHVAVVVGERTGE